MLLTEAFADIRVLTLLKPESLLSLLVQGLGVRGGGRDVGVTGSLVRAGGELELVGSLEAAQRVN